MKWWGLILVLTIIFWFSSLFYGFAQDDFIHLSVSSVNSLGEFLNFFNPFHQFPDIFFFRPLATQAHFFLMTKLFGLNALPFHIISLIFHILNGLLFYLIINKIWKNQKIAVLSAFLYSISSIHFLSLFYISSFQQIARTFYLFSAIYLYVSSLRAERGNLLYLGSLLAYIAALLSKETSLILPLLLPLLEILRRRGESIGKVLKENILPLMPFLGITITYIIIRAIGFQTIFTKGEYAYSLSIINILQNLKWYLIWTLGLPEILSTYPSLKPSSLVQFTKDFPYGLPILVLTGIFIINVILSLTSVILSVLAKDLTLSFRTSGSIRWRGIYKNILVHLLIFLLSLSPVLILSQHKYPQYLDLAFLGFLPLLGWVLLSHPERSSEGYKKIIAVVGILSFAALQYLSIHLSEETHWTTKRSKIAEHYHQRFITDHKNIEENTKIILVGSSASTREVSHALASKYAFLVWYPGKISDVQYLEEKDLPKDRSNLIIKYIDKY